MPAAPAPEELKERVKVVALQIGVREAARQFGLDEERVLKWSARGKWFETKALVAEAVGNYQVKQQVSSAVLKTPSEILATLGNKSKLRAAKLGDNTLRVLQRKAKATDGESLIPLAPVLKTTVDTLDKVHSWSTPAPSMTQVNVNVAGVRLQDS